MKPSTTSSSSSSPKIGFGMDALLTKKGKSLRVGEQIRIVLVKGPSGIVAKDPVSSKAPPETFPLVAKFPESVVKPNFMTGKFTRLYQQDTPKVQDDSDEEANAASNNPKKKRWRRKDVPKRQWVLQEETEFLETMMRKRQKKPPLQTKISSKYEGFPEHNPSHYVVLQVHHPTHQSNNNSNNNNDNDDDDDDDDDDDTIQVVTLPVPYGMQAFSQPTSRATLSLTEAEHAIQDQRAHMTRYMMHAGGGKSRLLGKLEKKAAGDDAEEDDVMADVTFQSRKGSASRARKELITSLAGEGITVDDDGVLGGANDSEFGGKRHFGRLTVDKDDATRPPSTGNVEKESISNDGLAMADDFYQRDVQAEYEDLDYDAKEQFDDDDVDLGEAEVMVDPNSGFADDDEEEDLDEWEEMEGGAEGLATLAGFRALLAKARGELPGDGSEATASEDKKDDKNEDESRPASPKTTENAAGASPNKLLSPTDSLAQVMAAAEKTAQAAKQKSGSDQDKKLTPTGVELDDKGQRLVTLEAIRREIWLHHGAIRIKRLMKIFDIKKKSSPDRRNKFSELVKELCIMKVDPVEGNMLVLKQHYSNMG